MSASNIGDLPPRCVTLRTRRLAGLWTVRDGHDGTLIGCAGFWCFLDPPELERVLSLSGNDPARSAAFTCSAPPQGMARVVTA